MYYLALLLLITMILLINVFITGCAWVVCFISNSLDVFNLNTIIKYSIVFDLILLIIILIVIKYSD